MTAATTARASALRSMRRARQRGEGRVGSLVVLVLATIAVLTPFVWVISLSFTPEAEAFGSVSLVPAHPTLENYATAFFDADLARALFNSAVVAGVSVATNAIFAVLAGYAFAMLPFPGGKALFYTLVSTAAIPISVTLIPLFLMARGIPFAGGNDILGQGGSGLLDTLAGVILPYVVMPMNIFLARQFFLSAPLELGEAARVDGASEWRIFFQVYLPLARPLVAVVAIFAFTGVWDDFLWPLVVTSSPEVQTVQLALARFLGSGTVQYGPLMAGTVIATVPVLIVFLLNQRGFISGLSDGSVKG